MPKGYVTFHRHSERRGEGLGPESLTGRQPENLEISQGFLEFAGVQPIEQDDESIARLYLSQIFYEPGPVGGEALEAMQSLNAPAAEQALPDLQLRAMQPQPLIGTRLVRFEQTHAKIPIFGSNVLVELGENQIFIGASGDMTRIQNVLPVPTLNVAQAHRKLAKFTGRKTKELKTAREPLLTFFFHEESDTWHLAYFFEKIPALPPGSPDEASLEKFAEQAHGLDLSPRLTHPDFDYLVDAHNGEILSYYSANPLFDIPVEMQGIDEEGVKQPFFGRSLENAFLLEDPLRGVKTYDLKFAPIQTQELPTTPVEFEQADFGSFNTAAISAHVNATRVLDFFKGELKRDGIDDKGSYLVSIVNVTKGIDLHHPAEWKNACWWNGRMWYGQICDESGNFHSYSRYLDVIAHELTHGITESTSQLVYLNQSGALNESISDIFGVIIRNWYEKGANSSVDDWNWELGSGLSKSGGPLRDLKTPTRCGFPDHMHDYRYLLPTWTGDFGGVHTNSNIHNKAAYNLLTIGDDQGNRIFEPREVTLLYYVTLTRLDKLADFSKVLQVLIDVASTVYKGKPDVRDKKIEAIRTAYRAVGIQ